MTGPPRRIFYGWWVVASFAVLNVYWAGTLVVGLTVFFTPVRQAFGWSAALLALIFSATSIVSGLVAPLVGAWFDRSGPRTLMLVASLLCGAGLVALSRTNSLASFVAAFLVVSTGFGIWAAGTGPAAAGLWFVRRRGLAMGVILAGVSVGGLLVPAWKLVLDVAGWRAAFLIAGLGLWLVSLPACFVLRHRPSDMGLLPDGALPQPHSPAPGAAQGGHRLGSTAPSPPASADTDLHAALRTWQFWSISGATSLALLGSSACTVLMLPRLQEARLDNTLALGAITAVTLLGAVGQLGSGWLADRTRPVVLCAASAGLQAVGLLAFALAPQQLPMLVLFVFAFGLGSANIRLLATVLLVGYYGPSAFGRIQGMYFVTLLPGRVLGPVIAGALHDGGYGYGPGFAIFAVVSLATVLPLLMLRTPARQVGVVPVAVTD